MSLNPFDQEFNVNKDQSALTFGYIDSDRYEGPIEWHPVYKKVYWSLLLDDILLNGVSLNICGVPDGPICQMTPDSGTTFMTMPTWAKVKFDEITF